ncbi:MAG: CHRD domain-containing protein, partial [Rhodothermales bacterium]
LYEITDPLGETDTAKVDIDVNRNERPQAFDDALTVLINAAVDIDVLDNDTDAEGDTLFITSIPDAPDNGAAEIIGDGALIRYTPNLGFLGTDTFDYIVTDGVPRSTPQGDRATVSVEVIPPGRNFVVVLSGAGVVPPVETRATGRVDASLDGNRLTFSGAFSRLKAAVVGEAGVLVQRGLAGQNGDLLFPLNVDLGLDMRSGTLSSQSNTFTLSNEEVNALFTRQMYINVITEALPGGEIRGQLLPDGADEIFRAVFSGRAAVPANLSGALGGVVAERFGDLLVVSGAFNGLESTFVRGGSGARLNQGFIGANGEFVRVLNVDLDDDRRGGTIEQADNLLLLTIEEIQLLESELLYIVIRTNNAREGEIRGQLLPLTKRTFEATLSGSNEVPPVQSAGAGGLIATLEGATLTLGGTLNGLTSGVDLTLRNGANVHEGAPNENGEIIIDLLPLLASDRRSGMFLTGSNQFTLSPPQLAALFDGQLYVNIHTDDDPEGEVRGQLLSSPNVPPISSSISSPEDSATIDLSGDPTTPFMVRWRTAPDPNGNTTYYRWQLARTSGFGGMVYESDLTTETELTTTFGALGTAMTAAGISTNSTVTLYHRVVSTDGALAPLGPASQLIVTRGLLTALEEAAVPEHFAVRGNYPNPFNPVTTVHVDLPQAARVQVEVYDVLGRRVLTMPAQHLEAGARRALTVDADRLTSGLYLYRVVALTDTGTLTGTGRMIVVK